MGHHSVLCPLCYFINMGFTCWRKSSQPNDFTSTHVSKRPSKTFVLARWWERQANSVWLPKWQRAPSFRRSLAVQTFHTGRMLLKHCAVVEMRRKMCTPYLPFQVPSQPLVAHFKRLGWRSIAVSTLKKYHLNYNVKYFLPCQPEE